MKIFAVLFVLLGSVMPVAEVRATVLVEELTSKSPASEPLQADREFRISSGTKSGYVLVVRVVRWRNGERMWEFEEVYPSGENGANCAIRVSERPPGRWCIRESEREEYLARVRLKDVQVGARDLTLQFDPSGETPSAGVYRYRWEATLEKWSSVRTRFEGQRDAAMPVQLLRRLVFARSLSAGF